MSQSQGQGQGSRRSAVYAVGGDRISGDRSTNQRANGDAVSQSRVGMALDDRRPRPLGPLGALGPLAPSLLF